jgi:glycosyltransferase involved in cell wall biosynthesis
VRIAVVVAGGVPNPAQSGSSVTVWTIVGHLLASGHEVTVVVLHGERLDDPGRGLDERVEALRGLGADVRLVRSRADEALAGLAFDARSRLRRAWRPPEVELLPQLVDTDAVAEAVEETGADVVYAYHWEAVAATRSLRGRKPRFATVVDLPQLSSWYRWRSTPGRLTRAGVSRLVWLQARLRRLPPLLVELLNECEASGNFAAHHAAWLRRRGAAGCAYYHTPIEDRPGGRWRDARAEHPRGGPPRLLLIGHLRGASTIDGLKLFAEGVLPPLERELGPDGVEVRLAGGYEPPDHLRRALERPSVRFLGHLERPDDEFAAADALVVPTSIPLGTRVRILSAFSFGCPVVAHEANAMGIPELADGENSLLGRSADDLAGAVLRLARDPALGRQLESSGRATYERHFAPPVAAAAVETTLRGLAGVPLAASTA